MIQRDSAINALIGAVVTLGLSFTGVSPLLGGGIAGYLQQESPKRGAQIGALSGGVALLPLVLMVLFGLILVTAVSSGDVGVPGGPELLIIFLLVVPTLLLWFVGLSAVGGYVGAYLRMDPRSSSRDSEEAREV